MDFMSFTPTYTSTAMRSFGVFIAICIIILFTGCEEDPYYFTYDYSDAPSLPNLSEAIETITHEDGLVIYIMERGTGTQEVTIRDNIFLYYTTFRGGTSRDNIVDSSYLNGSQASSQFAEIGTYQSSRGVGFVRGVLGMTEGEHRVISVPDSLNSYGDLVYWDVTLDYIAY